MNAHDHHLPIAHAAASESQALAQPVLARPLWSGFVGPDPRKFERRLGVILWVGLFAVLLTIG